PKRRFGAAADPDRRLVLRRRVADCDSRWPAGHRPIRGTQGATGADCDLGSGGGEVSVWRTALTTSAGVDHRWETASGSKSRELDGRGLCLKRTEGYGVQHDTAAPRQARGLWMADLAGVKKYYDWAAWGLRTVKPRHLMSWARDRAI